MAMSAYSNPRNAYETSTEIAINKYNDIITRKEKEREQNKFGF